jgi:cobalt-zinc-cadmium efflux system membrane fusion protein
MATSAYNDPTTSPAGDAPSPSSWLIRLRAAAPTASVAAALIGLAVLGHGTDWTVPKFSTLWGSAATAGPAWCAAHNVPEAICVECRPQLLRETSYGWCAEHGIDDCPLDHPEVAQLSAPPDTGELKEVAARALALRPRAENNSRCQLHTHHIQFASLESADKAGVDIALVDQQAVLETVTANGELVYDPTRAARLSSRAPGAVWRVVKQVGQPVRKGEVLALVDAAEVGRAKSDFLQAIAQVRLAQKTLSRLRPLVQDGTVPSRQFQEAETAAAEAEVKLLSTTQSLINLGLPVRVSDFEDLTTSQIAEKIQFLGLSDSMTAGLEAATTTSNLLPIASPLDGLVVECRTAAGEVVDSKTLLFDVADVSRLWLSLAVRQEDARYVRVGQKVLFRPADARSAADEVQGEIAWISTAADDRTRTVKVRADVPNAQGRLRANTFGTGRIVLRDEPRAIVVPSVAVHWDGDCSVVFVRDRKWFDKQAPKLFHVRKVRLGVRQGDMTEVIAGLLPGEVVAAKNSHVLGAQLLKSNLGAGCCEVP